MTTITTKLFAQTSYDTFAKNPWVPFADGFNARESYKEIVRKSRFFYRYDPIISAVINRIAEIGATEVLIDTGTLTDNEYQLLEYVRVKLQHYLKNAIRELLLSGLLYTDVVFKEVDSIHLRRIGVKYKQQAVLPVSISFRNPETLRMMSVSSPEDVTYYWEIPSRLIEFVLSEGVWTETGEKDEEAYKVLVNNYPALVKAIKDGKRTIRLYPEYEVVRLNTTPDSVYPIPYLTPIIGLLEHKRNLRRMDYALAARAIISILHVKAGNDQYPVTKDDEDVLDDLRNQFSLPLLGMTGAEYERIFQLFTNHTVEVEWITPPIEALLASDKYDSINEEILLGLGFPRYMIIGETRRTQAGNADIANSIVKTLLQTIRNDIIIVIRQIIYDIIEKNGFRGKPASVRLAPFNLIKFKELFDALTYLYETANISRTTLASAVGASYFEEVTKMEREKEIIEERGLNEFTPMPYSGKQPNGEEK